MKLLLTTLFIFQLCLSFADSAEAFLEISFTYQKEKQHLFLSNAYYFLVHPEVLKDQTKFRRSFYENYKSDTISGYTGINTHAAFVRNSDFPIKPFDFKGISTLSLPLKEIKEVSFVKLWTRSAYFTEHLCQLNLNDTSWTQKNIEVIRAGYQDVGCRLSVFRYSNENLDEQKQLIQKLYQLYPNDGSSPNDEELKKIKQLANRLKKYHAITIHSCGC